MVLKSIAVAAGACALVAGAAVAGSAAHASPSAPAPAQAQAAPSADLLSLSGTDAGTAATAGSAEAALKGRHKMCGRVPLAIERTQNLEKRLAADVSTPGSLAYLQRRIDVAQAAHKTQLVATLTNRMTYRKQLATFLPERLSLLQTAQRTVCATATGAPATS